MKREQREERISQKLDGELSPAERIRVEALEREDPELRATGEAWADLGRMARESAAKIPHPDVELAWQDIRRAIGLAAPEQEAPVLAWRLRWAGASLALLCVLAVSWGWWRGRGTPEALASGRSEVDWVEPGLAGTSPVVYEDEASGLTVIWMLAAEQPVRDRDT